MSQLLPVKNKVFSRPVSQDEQFINLGSQLSEENYLLFVHLLLLLLFLFFCFHLV